MSDNLKNNRGCDLIIFLLILAFIGLSLYFSEYYYPEYHILQELKELNGK